MGILSAQCAVYPSPDSWAVTVDDGTVNTRFLRGFKVLCTAVVTKVFPLSTDAYEKTCPSVFFGSVPGKQSFRFVDNPRSTTITASLKFALRLHFA